MKQLLIAIFCLGLFSGECFGNNNTTTPETDKQFSDQVNLALRQVGHQLLKLAGDERSAIPPVQITGPNEFTLKLENAFNYDTLPQLLDQALQSYEIQRDYQVIVKHCYDNTPILGYNLIAFLQGEVPCVGREQDSECSNIVLTFIDQSGQVDIVKGLLVFWFVLSILAVIGVVVFMKKIKRKINAPTSTSSDRIPLGNFSFDYQNQTLQLGDQQQQLTYRENKLLYFLANNANEVVKRDILIDNVWGDEGVMVGRSLDVFISRLRKLLKEDKTVRIKNIHSVGYRLEVTL